LLCSVCLKDAEDVAGLVQGVAAGGLDGGDGVEGAVYVVGERIGRGLSLDHHGHDQLRDLVLEVAGEAGALFGDGQVGALIAFGLEAGGRDLEPLGEIALAPDQPAGAPGEPGH
jgi:hypothetical protein